MKDRFILYQPSLGGPVNSAFAVTPSDTQDLREVTRALYLGAAGSMRVRFADGTEHTYAALAAGRHPLRVVRVFSTGTTATDITGRSDDRGWCMSVGRFDSTEWRACQSVAT